MAQCQSDYLLEKEAACRTDSDMLLETVRILSKQVADLTARVSVLELKKERYYIERNKYWEKLSPKLAWKRAKQNTIRVIAAFLTTYKPKKWYKNRWEWLQDMYVSPQISLHDVLSFALWPVIELRDDMTVLRGVDSTDHYHMFKRVWGKQKIQDLSWYREAIIEMKLPPAMFIDEMHICRLENEFQRLMAKFQSTKCRSGSQAPQGLIGLVRLWEKIYPMCEDEIIPICTSLAPDETLKWQISEPQCLHHELEEVRAESKSV
jgi:hypothetical protein